MCPVSHHWRMSNVSCVQPTAGWPIAREALIKSASGRIAALRGAPPLA